MEAAAGGLLSATTATSSDLQRCASRSPAPYDGRGEGGEGERGAGGEGRGRAGTRARANSSPSSGRSCSPTPRPPAGAPALPDPAPPSINASCYSLASCRQCGPIDVDLNNDPVPFFFFRPSATLDRPRPPPRLRRPGRRPPAPGRRARDLVDGERRAAVSEKWGERADGGVTGGGWAGSSTKKF